MSNQSPYLRLASFRKRKGMVLREFAAELGISIQHLCNIEKGRKPPGRDLAVRIEREAGIAVCEWSQAAQEAA